MKPTIEILENEVWPEPDFRSGLVLTAHALRKKPISELTPNDLRVAFNEDIGIRFVKQRVLEVLTADPAAGDLFEGDLIRAVMLSKHFIEDTAFRTKIVDLAALALQRDLDANTRREIEERRGT